MSAPSMLIVAGEASADLHGSKVMHALRLRRPDLQIFGVGGELMRHEGLESIARAEDISVAGLTEVLFAVPRILGILKKLERTARERRPSVALLLDLPDFNLRLAKRLRALGIRVVYYISPQVWAWRQGRVQEIKRIVDEMLVILPFEEAFYRRHGVRAQFVGHPLVEELPASPDRLAARLALGLPQEGEIVALLPGSRSKEISRHLPLMLEALARLQRRLPQLRAVLPVASTVNRAVVQAAVDRAGVEVTLLDGQATEALTAADAAVVCSGTATLQTALLLRPMVVVYRVSWLTYHILKRLVRVANIALVNLIAQRPVVTELIQDGFTAERVEAEVLPLLDDTGARREMTEGLSRIRKELGSFPTAERVAEVTLRYIEGAHA